MRDLNVAPLPNRLYIECTAACNISCFQACCAPETGITRTRQAGMLDWDLFTRAIDEAGPSLVRVDFFNYGEAFLHKRAVEMCEYIKTRFPHIYLYTSTNGLAFNEERARRLVHSGIDEVTFSLDGASQDTYARYRQRGKFEVALANLRALTDEKAKSGTDVPHVNWRYILFKWNDSDEEMARARQLATEVGVDRLCWEITDHPEDSFSRRFVKGSPDYDRIAHEVWDSSMLGNAIPGATPRAQIDVRQWLPALPLKGRASQPTAVKTRVRNLSSRPFRAQASYGRRLVRLGAQLLDQRRPSHQSRSRPRLAARRHPARRFGGRADRHPCAVLARPLHVEVRPGQRRHRLVRSLRVADDGQRIHREVGSYRPATFSTSRMTRSRLPLQILAIWSSV